MSRQIAWFVLFHDCTYLTFFRVHTPNLSSCINLVITKYKLKSQYVQLTQLWPLTVNCVKVGSQSYLVGLSLSCQKFVSSAHMWTKWSYSRDLMFWFYFSFTKFSQMFFPLYWKDFVDILKIHEPPKIHNKIPKNSCPNNNHLPGQLYVPTASGFWTITLLTLLKFALEQKRLFLHRVLKNPRQDFFRNVAPKKPFFVASDTVSVLCNKPWICPGD